MAEFYKIKNGYILKDNVWSASNEDSDIIDFVPLSIGDKNPIVTLLQSKLLELNIVTEEELEVTGEYDISTFNAVKKFQRLKNINDNGVCDQFTWTAIQEALDTINNITTGYRQEFSDATGVYQINTSDDSFLNRFKINIISPRPITVKRVAIIYYKNGTIDHFSYTEDITEKELTLNEFKDCFYYNEYYGDPIKIEYIIYPYSKTVRKYIFELTNTEV